MMYLMTSPRIYQELKREIAEGIQNGRISAPVTNDEAKKLPYLQVSHVAIAPSIRPLSQLQLTYL
jgi:hypothetical protein